MIPVDAFPRTRRGREDVLERTVMTVHRRLPYLRMMTFPAIISGKESLNAVDEYFVPQP